MKLPSELWSSGALPRWFKYGSAFSFSNPPPRFSNPKKSSRKRFIFHSFTNFTLNRGQLLTTLYVTLQLKCLSILYSSTCSALQKQNEEASSEYIVKNFVSSSCILLLDVVNLPYNFIEVTLRRYSTAPTVKEQN